MDSFLNNSITEFCTTLSSSAPVPGGGGASALAGALGASLGNMVCSLTTGKKKYRDVEEDIQRITSELSSLRDRLLECVNRDAEAFEPLSRAYSIPKDQPDRQEIMEECLRNAAAVPFEILELSCKAIPLLEELEEKGSRLAVSDAAVGAAMSRAAIQGAAANVYINTALMKDREYAEELNGKTVPAVSEFCARADNLYNKITGGMING